MLSILVGIDASERGEKALAWVARYASSVEGAALCLVSVVDLPGVSAPEDAVEQVRAACEKNLKALCERLAAEFSAPRPPRRSSTRAATSACLCWAPIPATPWDGRCPARSRTACFST